MTLRSKLLIAAVLPAAVLAAAPASAAEFTESFDPFAGWSTRWFAANSNAANYYATEFGDPVDYQGAPDNGGLVLSDGDNYQSNLPDYTTIGIRFSDAFAASLTQFQLDVASSLDDVDLVFFDRAGATIASFTVAASPQTSPYLTPVGYQGFAVSSANGIGGFSFGSGAQGSVILDNLSAVTADAAAVPEPATWAAMVLGFGIAGASVRRRRTGIRFA